MCFVFLVVSYFISRDISNLSLDYMAISLEELNLEGEVEKWTNQLAMCKWEDKEHIQKVKDKLAELNKKLNEL